MIRTNTYSCYLSSVPYYENNFPLSPYRDAYSDFIKDLQAHSILDCEGEVINGKTEETLLPDELIRLDEAFSNAFSIECKEKIVSLPLKEILHTLLKKLSLLDAEVTITGSYVFKILGWPFVLRSFMEANFPLEKHCSPALLAMMKSTIEALLNDIDVRIKFPKATDRETRERIKRSIPQILSSLLDHPILRPFKNVEDVEEGNKYVVFGLGIKNIFSAECLLTEKLARRNFCDKDAPQIKLNEGYFAGINGNCKVNSGSIPLLKALVEKLCDLITIRNPHEVNAHALYRVLYDMSKGFVLKTPEALPLILNKAALYEPTLPLGERIAALLLTKMQFQSDVDKIPVLKQSWDALVDWEISSRYTSCKDADRVKMIESVLQNPLKVAAFLLFVNPVLSNQYDFLKCYLKNVASDDEQIFLVRTVPEFCTLPLQPKPFLEKLIRIPGCIPLAWKLYRDLESDVPINKFLLGALKSNIPEGLQLLAEAEVRLELKHEALEYFWNHIPKNIFPHSSRFLIQALQQFPDIQVQKFKTNSWILPLILQEAIYRRAPLPKSLMLEAFFHTPYGCHFLRYLIQDLEKETCLKVSRAEELFTEAFGILFFRLAFLIEIESFTSRMIDQYFEKLNEFYFELAAVPPLLEKSRVLLKLLAARLEKVKLIHWLEVFIGKEEFFILLIHANNDARKDETYLYYISEALKGLKGDSYPPTRLAKLTTIFIQNPPPLLTKWISTFRILQKAGSPSLCLELAHQYVSCRLEQFNFQGPNSQQQTLFRLFLDALSEKNHSLLTRLGPEQIQIYLPSATAERSYLEVAEKLLKILNSYFIQEKLNEVYFDFLLTLVLPLNKKEIIFLPLLKLLSKTQLLTIYCKFSSETSFRFKTEIFSLIILSEVNPDREVVLRMLSVITEKNELLAFVKILKNFPLLLHAFIIENVFSSLNQEKEFFPYLKEALQKDYKKTVSSPVFTYFLSLPEGQIAKEQAFLNYFPNDYTDKFPDGREVDNSSTFVFESTPLYLFQQDSKEIEGFSNAFKRALIDKIVLLRRRKNSSQFDLLLNRIIQRYIGFGAVDKSEGSLLESVYQELFIELRNIENRMGRVFSYEIVLKVLCRCVYGVRSFKENELIPNGGLVQKDAFCCYQGAALTYNLVPEDYKRYASIPYVEVLKIDPDLHKDYFEHLFFLMELMSKELNRKEHCRYQHLDFLGNQLWNSISLVKNLSPKLINAFLDQFKNLYSMSIRHMELINYHMEVCKELFLKLQDEGLYESNVERYIEDTIYLSIPLSQQTLDQEKESLDIRVKLFSKVTTNLWGKFYDSQYTKIAVIVQLLSILKFYPSILFLSTSGYQREKVVDKVLNAIYNHPYILESKWFKLKFILNALFPIFIRKDLTCISVDVKKLEEFGEKFPDCMKGAPSNVKMPERFKDSAYVYMRVQLQKMFAGYFFSRFEEWEAHLLHSTKGILPLLAGVEEYKGQFCRLVYMTAQFICQEHEKLKRFKCAYIQERQYLQFRKFVDTLFLCNIENEEKNKLLWICMAIGEKGEIFNNLPENHLINFKDWASNYLGVVYILGENRTEELQALLDELDKILAE